MKTFSALTKIAFKEILSNKAYYVLFLFSFVLLVISVFASYLTVSAPDRVVLDFGISISRVLGIVLSIWISSNLISSDIEKKTIQIVLTKPITRIQYFTSKVISLMIVLLVSFVFLFLLFYFVYQQSGGSFHINLIYAFQGIYYQAIIAGCFTLILSIYFSKMFSTLMGASFVLLGLSSNEFHFLKEQVDSNAMKALFQFFVVCIPNLEQFHLEFFTIYRSEVSSSFLMTFNLYFFIWMILLVALGGLIINKKEF